MQPFLLSHTNLALNMMCECKITRLTLESYREATEQFLFGSFNACPQVWLPSRHSVPFSDLVLFNVFPLSPFAFPFSIAASAHAGAFLVWAQGSQGNQCK
jgi:hypothetical protein